MTKGTVRIGCSGWHYKDWRGPFYGADTPADAMLEAYGEVFSTAEINNSFYTLPDGKTVRAWAKGTPHEFVFSWKASRYLTHMKKLKDPGQPTRAMLDAAAPLGGKLGPLLYQLPARWKPNPERLDDALACLPEGHRATVELRDRRWFCEEVLSILKARNVALCLYDFRAERSPIDVTADFVYIRLHGPHAEPYQGRYDGRTLDGWARRIAAWRDEGRDVYCYFDNDQGAAAPHDARVLIDQVHNHAP